MILLQEAAQPGGISSTMLMIGLMVVVFYFFMIRPQAKKNKAMIKFKDELEKGGKVITNGGIHGKIIEVKETSFIIDAGGNTKFRIEKSGINMEATQALNKTDGEKESA